MMGKNEFIDLPIQACKGHIARENEWFLCMDTRSKPRLRSF